MMAAIAMRDRQICMVAAGDPRYRMAGIRNHGHRCDFSLKVPSSRNNGKGWTTLPRAVAQGD
jgi:hypothetical protein